MFSIDLSLKMKEKYKIKDPVSGLYFSIKEMPKPGDVIMYRKQGNGSLVSVTFNPVVENHILNTFFNKRGRLFYSEAKAKEFILKVIDENLLKVLKRCIIVKYE